MSNGRNLCESSGGGRNVGLTRQHSTGRTSHGFPRILPTRISPTGGIVQVMNYLNTQRSLSPCGTFSPEEAFRPFRRVEVQCTPTHGAIRMHPGTLRQCGLTSRLSFFRLHPPWSLDPGASHICCLRSYGYVCFPVQGVRHQKHRCNRECTETTIWRTRCQMDPAGAVRRAEASEVRPNNKNDLHPLIRTA